MRRGLIIANFGGPCCPQAIEPFLRELLLDTDVIRSGLPQALHRKLFSWIAKRRAKKVTHEYAKMGGLSPIYQMTERLRREVIARGNREGNQLTLCSGKSELQLDASAIWTFHRYLPMTHPYLLKDIAKKAADLDEIRVVTCFPQFTYATVGSVARFLRDHLNPEVAAKVVIIPSYPDHPGFIKAYTRRIEEVIQRERLSLDECALLCSFHGIPRKFITSGDIYDRQCQASFQALLSHFPGVPAQLAYQSKFGPGEWLRPYTQDACADAPVWAKGRKRVLVVPLAFTSDHIETLVEIEDEYLPILRSKGFEASRVEALNMSAAWIEALEAIITTAEAVPLNFLVASYCNFPKFCRIARSFIGCSGQCGCVR